MPDLSAIQADLDNIGSEINAEFPGAEGRLEQFNDHLATLKMTIGHLFDEAERMPDAGYRKTPDQKIQEAVERQKVLDDLRARGVNV